MTTLCSEGCALNLIEGEAAEKGNLCYLDRVSRSRLGRRIYTFRVRYYRSRLVETNTHRMFSRNARSTRAVPTKTFIQEVRNNPAGPLFIGKNCKGMASSEKLPDSVLDKRQDIRHVMIEEVEKLLEEGVHKQDINNLLEPWMWTDQLITTCGEGLVNFVKQRTARREDGSPAAAPEMYMLGEAMKKALDLPDSAVPVSKWHIPFILDEEESLSLVEKVLVSVGRCASVSYIPPGDTEVDCLKDINRAVNTLYKAKPVRHESPFEHVAVYTGYINARFANFTGWCSIRTLMSPSCIGDRLVLCEDPLDLVIKTSNGGSLSLDEVGEDFYRNFAIGAVSNYWAYEI